MVPTRQERVDPASGGAADGAHRAAREAPVFARVAIEEVRDFWDRRPCNIRHSPQPVGTKAYFDEVEARKYFVEPHIPRFADFARWRGKRVLELGCGIGTDTINFARAGAQVTAVDISAESLKLARKRAQVYGLADRIRFYQANGEELSNVVPVEPYDLVYAFGVVHHTPHPDRAVAELRRYLDTGGIAKVMVYHRHAWKVLEIILTHGKGRFWRLPELIASHSEAQTGCPVTFTFTRAEARQLLEGQGLRVTGLSVAHIFPYRVADYVRFRYVRAWPFRFMPTIVFNALERRFGWHLCLTAQAT